MAPDFYLRKFLLAGISKETKKVQVKYKYKVKFKAKYGKSQQFDLGTSKYYNNNFFL